MYYPYPPAGNSVVAIDRQHLRRDAHFVGMSIIAITVAMYALAFAVSMGLAITGIRESMSDTQIKWLNILLYVLTMVPPVALTAWSCRQPIRPLSAHRAIHPLPFICFVCIGLAVCLFANYIANYVAAFLSQFGIVFPDFSEGIEPTAGSLALNLFSTALLPGIFEEMAFRGYLLQALRRYGDGFAVMVSSLLFGLLHGNFLQIPFAVIVGLICGYAVIQTGNIWVAVTIHTLNNALSVILTAVGKAVSPEAYIRLTITLWLALAVVGAIAFVGLKAMGSPLLERPTAGWTSLSKADKWSGLFKAPAFLIGVILLVLVSLFNTLSTSMA